MAQQSDEQDTFWWRLFHLEPTLFRGLVLAIFAAIAAVGVHFAPGIPDALIGVVVVLLPVVQLLWTRPAVTANAKVVVTAPDPIGTPTVVRAGEAVTTATDTAIVSAARSAA